MNKYTPSTEDIEAGLAAYFASPRGNAYSPRAVVEAALNAVGQKIAEQYYEAGRRSAKISVPKTKRRESTSDSK